MSENIIEQGFVPYFGTPPSVINKEKFIVYIPVVGPNKPGVAAFDGDHFVVQDQRVSLRPELLVKPDNVYIEKVNDYTYELYSGQRVTYDEDGNPIMTPMFAGEISTEVLRAALQELKESVLRLPKVGDERAVLTVVNGIWTPVMPPPLYPGDVPSSIAQIDPADYHYNAHAMDRWTAAFNKQTYAYGGGSFAAGGGSIAGVSYLQFIDLFDLEDTQESKDLYYGVSYEDFLARNEYEDTESIREEYDTWLEEHPEYVGARNRASNNIIVDDPTKAGYKYWFATALGEITRALGRASTAMGHNNVAGADRSVVSGAANTINEAAELAWCHGQGNKVHAHARSSVTIGLNNFQHAPYALIIGKGNSVGVTAENSVVLGENKGIHAPSAFVWGKNNELTKEAAGAFIAGTDIVCYAPNAIVIGHRNNVTTSAKGPQVFGSGHTVWNYADSQGNQRTPNSASVFGSSNTVYADAAFAANYHQIILAGSASAFGASNYVGLNGANAFVCGYSNNINNPNQFACGRWCASRAAAFIVGGGNANSRYNIHEVDWDGNGFFLGDVYIKAPKGNTNAKRLITEDDVRAILAEEVGVDPNLLDSFYELSKALGDDKDFAANVNAALATKATQEALDQGLAAAQDALIQGLDLKVNKSPAPNTAYVNDANGTVVNKTYASTALADTIMVRDDNGSAEVNVATKPYHAVPYIQLEEIIETAANEIISEIVDIKVSAAVSNQLAGKVDRVQLSDNSTGAARAEHAISATKAELLTSVTAEDKNIYSYGDKLPGFGAYLVEYQGHTCSVMYAGSSLTQFLRAEYANDESGNPMAAFISLHIDEVGAFSLMIATPNGIATQESISATYRCLMPWQ